MPGEGEGERRCLFFHYKGRANKETGTKSLRGLSYLTRGGLEEEIDRSTGGRWVSFALYICPVQTALGFRFRNRVAGRYSSRDIKEWIEIFG